MLSYYHFCLHEISFSIRSLSVCVLFTLMWASCRQHIVGSYFLIQSATHCLLIPAFSPLAVKVIINRCIFITIFTLIFQLILYLFFIIFFPFVVWWFLLYYAYVLFLLIFVTLLYVLNLWFYTQSCPTLCDPMDCTVHGILQARILEWVAFPFSRGSSQPRDPTQVSLTAGRFFTSWTTGEAQEYWSG